MELSLILTIAGTGLAVVGSNIALIGWLRSDMKSFETEIRSWKDEIQKEMRDFHGRLSSIEARYHEENYKTKSNSKKLEKA